MKQYFNRLFFIFLFSQEICLATDILLPPPTGPYSVGTKAIEMKDSSRTMLRDSSQRRWMIQAFYPSQSPDQQTYPYMPETLKDGLVKGVRVLTHSKPKAEILKQKTFPVIIFVPGLGEERQKYTLLFEELSSHGYIVLSLDQPYVSNFVAFPDENKIVLTLQDAWKSSRDRDYRYQYYDDAMNAAIADIKYLLDHFESFNQTYFNGQLNQKSIVLMGHSFGGNVSHTLGFLDHRVRAIVDIDSKITERKIYGRIGVPPNPTGKPVLFIRAIKQYQEDVGDQLTQIKNAHILTFDVQHSAFQDTAYLVRKIDALKSTTFLGYFINWLLKKGPHFNAVDTDLGSYTAEEWFNTYRLQIVRWLKELS